MISTRCCIADRQLLHEGVGIHAQAEPLGEREHVTAGRAPVEQAKEGRPSGPLRTGSLPSVTFSATVKTGTSMKC